MSTARERKKQQQQHHTTLHIVVDFVWLVSSSDDVSSFQYQSFFRFCRALNEFFRRRICLNANKRSEEKKTLKN